MEMKGILEEFKEFIRPKSIQEKLALNQKKLRKQKRNVQKMKSREKEILLFKVIKVLN